jgi:hypothetical protein
MSLAHPLTLYVVLLAWTLTLYQLMLTKVRENISDTSVHAYQNFHIIRARKPFPNEVM